MSSDPKQCRFRTVQSIEKWKTSELEWETPQSPRGPETSGQEQLNAVFNGLEWMPDECWRAPIVVTNQCDTFPLKSKLALFCTSGKTP